MTREKHIITNTALTDCVKTTIHLLTQQMVAGHGATAAKGSAFRFRL